MASSILFIGLGQVGASFGLALRKGGVDADRIGFDPDSRLARTAELIGAVDRLTANLSQAAAQADVVLLCVRGAAGKPLLEQFGSVLKEGAVLVDASPLRVASSEWARRWLGPGRSYVGLMPGLSASLLEQGPLEALEPSADLFQGATFGLAIPPGTPEGAARVALNLSRSVGAEPFFMDAAEVDNVAATVDAVPALFGAALVRVATRSPSWHEVRRLAGRAFAALCGPVVSGSSESLPSELTLNRETVVPKLDEVLEELRQLRAMIAQGDEAGLADRLRAAHQAYETWIVERRNADWASEGMAAPAVAKVGMAERLFGTRRPRGRTKDKG